MHDIPAGSKAAEAAPGSAPLSQPADAPAAAAAVISPAPVVARVRNVAVDAYRGFVMFLMMAEVLQLEHLPLQLRLARLLQRVVVEFRTRPLHGARAFKAARRDGSL